jgi:peptidoglycan hydrolase-like protein with peptidoglycan-binding domain
MTRPSNLHRRLTTVATTVAITALSIVASAPTDVAARGAPEAPAAGSELIGLRAGARGPAVVTVQRAILAAGSYLPGGVDGVFGPATAKALADVQRWNRLEVTGTVTAPTAALLARVTVSPVAPAAGRDTPRSGGAPTTGGGFVGLGVGSTGDKVKQVQRALISTGLTLRGGADGVFGPATAATLRSYQGINGRPRTGVVSGRDAQLLGLGSGSPATKVANYPRYGERSDRVAGLQRALSNAGVRVPGGADGIFGPATAGAVMEFQRRHGLTVSGTIDDATARPLGVVAGHAPAATGGSAGARGLTLSVFPVQGPCWFADTWHAPRGGGRLHVGVDVIAAEGKYLYAVADGTISKRYWDYPGSNSGNGVRLTRPDGTYFVYLHLLDVAPGIRTGTRVKAGQIIGVVGSTGSSATPHLHFEIHPNGGAPVNPYPVVKAIDACGTSKPLPQP